MIESENQEATGATMARYVYCIIPGEVGDWQLRGLDGQLVRAICAAGLTALVHDCPAEPYQGDEDKVKAWVLAHSDVVDAAWECSGRVLPMSFDTIIRSGDGLDADEQVRQWPMALPPEAQALEIMVIGPLKPRASRTIRPWTCAW